MGLFGSGHLRRQIAAMSDELTSLQGELSALRSDHGEIKKQLNDKDAAIRESRDAKKKTEQKLEKIAAAKRSAESRLKDKSAEADSLKKEVSQYRADLRKTRDELDKAYGERERVVVQQPAAPAVEEQTKDAEAQPAKAESPTPQRVDRRIERLEEQLGRERDKFTELKGRVSSLEKTARDADRRRISELNKAEAVVRDLQHAIRSERRAYKILQLQYEALLDVARANGVQTPELAQPPATVAVPTDDNAEAPVETKESQETAETPAAEASPSELPAADASQPDATAGEADDSAKSEPA
ncbi:MAG: hypothetical protein ACON3Z_07010 [Bradymonadia bacterium]